MRRIPAGPIIFFALFYEFPILGWLLAIVVGAIVLGGMILSGCDSIFSGVKLP